MTSIVIMDTSVFCNLLDIPGKNQHHRQSLNQLEQYIDEGCALLLPIAAVYETGNHITYCGDGGQRRQLADRFITQLRQAINGDSPWTPTPFHDRTALANWLAVFPEHAMREISFSDLSIIKIWEEQCTLNRGRRVLIWTLDNHLNGYDRGPEI